MNRRTDAEGSIGEYEDKNEECTTAKAIKSPACLLKI